MTIQHEHKPLSPRQIAALTAALNPARVASRSQGRTSLSYLEAWDVKATLIKVFGFGGFSADIVESEMLRAVEVPQSGNASKTNWKITYRARVRLTIHQTGATYTEDAIADSSQPDFTECSDMALKSAESDALKRAAIYLGTQFGLSLYNAGSTQDVVKVVLAEDQEFPPPNPDQKAQRELQARREIEYMNAIVEGIDPETAKANIWGAPMQSPNAQARPVMVPEGSAQTPEQYAESQALVQRALSMKAQQAAQQESGPDVPLYRDTSLDDNGDAAEAYAAADGHHE